MKANQSRDTFVRVAFFSSSFPNKLDRFSCLFVFFAMKFVRYNFCCLCRMRARFIMRTICSSLAATGFRLYTNFSLALIYLFISCRTLPLPLSTLCNLFALIHTLNLLHFFYACRQCGKISIRSPINELKINNIFCWYFCQHFIFEDAFVVAFQFVLFSVTFGKFFISSYIF